jgi:hypothetical protein
MTNETAVAIPEQTLPPDVMEKVVIAGDLAELNAAQRAEYYTAVCRSLGLNPLTKPFEFLTLNGKLRLYALRDCTDQLRRLHGISIYIASRERMNDIYIVTARARTRDGREDESTGAVTIGNLKGDALCNAYMKAETKSKRRVTLSIAGLGWLDETELDTIPAAKTGTPADWSAAVEHSRPSEPVTPSPLHEGEGTPAPADRHPTAYEVNRLVQCALHTNITMEVFGADMRRLMGLLEGQKVTKKFLRERMTMAQYEKARSHYGQTLAEILNQDVPDFPPTTAALHEVQRSEPVAAPPPPAEDPDAEAKAKLRAEVATWALSVAPEEIEYILAHYAPEKARALLWGARRLKPAATPIEAAAD